MIAITYPGYAACGQCGNQFYKQTPDATRCPLCDNNIGRIQEKAKAGRRTCDHCGTAFRSTNSTKRYCSGSCRVAAELVRRKEQKLVTLTCAHCGKAFETTDVRKVACSRECKAGYRRAWARERDRQKREELKGEVA